MRDHPFVMINFIALTGELENDVEECLCESSC